FGLYCLDRLAIATIKDGACRRHAGGCWALRVVKDRNQSADGCLGMLTGELSEIADLPRAPTRITALSLLPSHAVSPCSQLASRTRVNAYRSANLARA